MTAEEIVAEIVREVEEFRRDHGCCAVGYAEKHGWMAADGEPRRNGVQMKPQLRCKYEVDEAGAEDK